MISFKIDEVRFNFRVAGILFRDNKVLIHRTMQDDFYAFPGGRVEMLEDTETTVIREFKEELNINIDVKRLLWLAEHFFTHNNEKFHEICFYYLVNGEIVDQSDCFIVVEGDTTYEFKWVDIETIEDVVLYPTFIKNRLNQLPTSIEKVVDIG